MKFVEKCVLVNNSAWAHEMRGMYGMKTVSTFSTVFQVIIHVLAYAYLWRFQPISV